jgi:hypothetical protein
VRRNSSTSAPGWPVADRAARAELGTRTIRDTVNEALVRAAGKRSEDVRKSLDRLASLELVDREDAWR